MLRNTLQQDTAYLCSQKLLSSNGNSSFICLQCTASVHCFGNNLLDPHTMHHSTICNKKGVAPHLVTTCSITQARPYFWCQCIAESGPSARRSGQASTPTSQKPPGGHSHKPSLCPALHCPRGHCRDRPWQGPQCKGQCAGAAGSEGLLEWGLSGVWGRRGCCQHRL